MSARNDDGWRLEPHVCRCCFSRLVSRSVDGVDGRKRLYKCPNCDLQAEGARADVLCACGLKVRNGKGTLVDAGVRCHENRARSPGFPSLYVATIAGAQGDA